MDNKTVAIIGASAGRNKYSNKSVRAHLQQGWDVYPVNPKGGEIEGLKVYASVKDVPVKLHRVSLYLPPAVGIDVLPDIAAIKPEEFFANPGSESDKLIARARELGLDPILACSIVDLGVTPAEFAN